MRTHFDPDTADVDIYRVLTAVVVPRPIAWVSSTSREGVVNLAPHSFYTVACVAPPIIAFTSVGTKDTLTNIRDTEEFVVNLAPAALLEQVNNSAARFAPEHGEPDKLGIDTEPSGLVAVPRVTESPVAIECRLHSTLSLGNSTMVLGRVVRVSVRPEVLVDGTHPDYDLLDPLTRLGRDEWGLHAEVRSLTRPQRPEDIRRTTPARHD